MDDTMPQEQTSAQKPAGNGSPNVSAVFLGWQTVPTGEPVALYNVTAPSHPLHGSTVTDATLREHNVPVPETPPPTFGGGRSDKFGSDQPMR